MNEIINMISTVGFPIFACCCISYYAYKQTLLHKEEVLQLKDTIDRNTTVLEKILTKLDMFSDKE